MNATFKDFTTVFCLATFFVVMLTSGLCYGHEGIVHEQITQSAFGLSSGLADFLSENSVPQNLTANPPQCNGNRSPMEWLKLGSFMEDEQKYGFFGFFGSELGDERCVDHFYTVQSERTPGQTIGLTDWSEPPAFGLAVRTFTTNSFRWATDNTVQGPYGIGTNSFKWEDARQYEFAALTNSAPDDRNTGMAMMFYCLGHILHLNQDLTSPDHVRDAAHLNTAYFEKFGAANYTNNPQWFVPPQHDQQGWAYWQAQGFSKLLDFWDRSNYVNGSSQALNNEAKGDVKLGVAEFSNGNFMGETALYKECYSSGDIHSFPFPSLFSSTSYPVNKDIASYLDSHLRTNFLSNGGINPKGSLVPRVYIDKTGDGITFSNHSVLSYLGAYALGGLSGRRANLSPAVNQVSVSIHDNNVLQAYHDRLIPKAVEYSAGLLDYFLPRHDGCLGFCGCQYKLHIRNHQYLQPGFFRWFVVFV